MRITFLPEYNKISNNKSFGSTSRYYKTKNNVEIGTNTWFFREDLDWNYFAAYSIAHFKEKEKVNVIQLACSDGSEAYTTILSFINNKNEDFSKFFPIQAFDIDNEVIKAAKSGCINIKQRDYTRLSANSVYIPKYFKPAAAKLVIPNDGADILFYNNPQFYTKPKTYKVCDELTNKVNFNRADMFNVLRNIKDDSNTIVFCRNVFAYLPAEKTKEFVEILSKQLKKNSLFVSGSLDSENTLLDYYLSNNGFKKIMNNVYEKTV